MFIGIGNPIPTIANLPGSSRPGGGSGGGGGGVDQIANNYSMELNGIDENFVSPIPGSFFSKSNSWSLSCWVQCDVRTTTKGIFGNTSNASGIRLRSLNSGSPVFGIKFDFNMVGTGTWNGYYLGVVSSDYVWSNSTWYHIVVTYDGSSTGAGLKMYVNNNLTTSGSSDFTISDCVSSLDFAIGTLKPSYGGGHDGRMDEVALFDYKLEESDVQAIYDATDTNLTADLSSMATPPVAWYRMGD